MTLVSSLDKPVLLDRQPHHAGRTIFREGSRGDVAYVIEKGTVDIVRDGPDGRVRLARLKQGSIFGEMALLDDAPRMASAIAVEPTVLITIKRETLRRKLELADPFIAKMLLMMMANLRSLTDDHVSKRALPTWLEGNCLDLDFCPEEVASSLAAAPFVRRGKAKG